MSVHDMIDVGFGTRWAAYFRERFPPLQYAAALGVFSFATLAYSTAAAGLPRFPAAYPTAVAFAVTFLAFLQLRIHDEFKDFEDDARYRPERPVPRGLVTLDSLERLGWIAAGVQLVLSATLGAPLIALAIAILAYSWLMRVEFFARAWLRERAVAYLLSHMLIIPLVTLYVAACAAVVAIERLGWYLAFSYFSFCVFEIGRKVWAPDEERPGVETYTALWGRPRAVAAWLGSVYASAGTAIVAAHALHVAVPVAVAAVAIALPATVVGVWFVASLIPIRGAWFRALSALWFLGIHAAIGGAVLHTL